MPITPEEVFETLTLKQLGRHDKPIALLNTLGCYDAMQELLRRSAETGFMSANCLKLYALCDSPAAALDYVENADRLTGGISRLEDYAK